MRAMSEPLYDGRTLWELVERRAAESPDHPMLLDERGRRVTFGEFKAWAERTAAGFYDLGVREGTAVTWQLPTRMETVVASMALSRLGAVQNPIIPIYRQREVGFLLRETGAEFSWSRARGGVSTTWTWATRLAKDMDRAADGDGGLRLAARGDPASLPPPPGDRPSDEQPVRWIYSTSGTTSDPKGVRHTDATLIAGGIGLAVALDMSPADVGSMAFPYTHIGGPDYLITLLAVGFPAILLETFVPAQAVEVLRRHGATMAGGSTAFYQAFVNEQRSSPTSRSSRPCGSCRGAGRRSRRRCSSRSKRVMHIPCVHGMGMTEVPMAVPGRSARHRRAAGLHRRQAGPGRRDQDRRRGRPPSADRHRRRAAGPRARWCARATPGPSSPPHAFDDDGFFRTGDLAHVRPDGHVVLTGRIKDIIIRKGENIGAKEIEDLLYQHPKIGRSRRDRPARPGPGRTGLRRRRDRARAGAASPSPRWPTTAAKPG